MGPHSSLWRPPRHPVLVRVLLVTRPHQQLALSTGRGRAGAAPSTAGTALLEKSQAGHSSRA